MSIEPFKARIPQHVLDELRQRLAHTRWPDQVEGQNWQQGTEMAFLKRLCAYWSNTYDWRASEARLNGFLQYRAIIEGTGLHFIHAKSEKPDAMPLLITNGWPSSIFEYLDIIPLLTEAGFHVVAPALPGYGFSDRPAQFGMNPSKIGTLFAALMSTLGYERFLAHASDMGAAAIEGLRRRNPERLIGIHQSNVWWGYPRPDNPTPEEKAYLEAGEKWQKMEGAYALIQGTKPQTLSYGLNDSPAGLAAWIIEKFKSWSDGDIEKVYGFDGLCANLTLYWVTETIGSSVRLYSEAFKDTEMQKPAPKSTVRTAIVIFPKDIVPAPRAWGERWLNIVQWTEAPRGGHFPAWETPEILAQDIALFAGTLRGNAG